MATLQVPGQAAASNRPPRTSSLPRSPKSSRGRPRKPKPAPPPTLQERVATIKRSPYFLPALVAFLAFFLLLVYSAVRIAAHTDAPVVLSYDRPATSRPKVASPPRPKPVSASPDSAPGKPRLTPEEVGRAAEEALEKVWGLGSDSPAAKSEPGLEQPAKQVPLGKSAEELAAAKLRFEEMMRATEDMSADDLTMMLNDAYREARDQK